MKKEILDAWLMNGETPYAEVRFKKHRFWLYASDVRGDRYVGGKVALRLLVTDMVANPMAFEVGKVYPNMPLRKWKKFVRAWLANNVGKNFRIFH